MPKKKAEAPLFTGISVGILDLAPFGAYVLNGKGVIEYYNPAMVKMAGIKSAKQAVGKNVMKLSSYRKAGIIPYMKKGLDGKPFRLEAVEFSSASTGKTTIRNYQGIPIKGDKEKAGKLLIIVEDITQMKKAEMELRESEKEYRRIVEAAIEGIWLMNADGITAFVNEIMPQILGYTKKEVLGKHFSYFMPKQEADGLRKMFRQGLKNLKKPYEFEFIKKNKEKIICHLSATQIYKGTRIVGLLAFVHDITEQKKAQQELRTSEEEYRRIVETAIDGIWLINKEGITTFVNNVMPQMLGLRKNDMLGKHALYFAPPEEIAKFEKLLVKWSSGVKEVYEVVLWEKNRNRITTIISATPIYQDKRIVGTLAFVHDISKRKKAEQELQEAYENLQKEKESVDRKVQERTKELQDAYEKLKELDQAKDEFVSLVSHELKSPIFPITGYTEMLMDEEFGKLTKEQKEKLEIIHRNANDLRMLIEDMLDISRLQLERIDLDLTKCDLRQIAHNVKNNLSVYAASCKARITLAGLEQLMVKCDRNRVQQVISNIVRNAIAYGKAGRPNRIDINVKKKGELAFVEVKDKGIGIPKEKQKMLFTKFYQAADSGTRKHGGTGLGLAISKGLVELHGGRMYMESQEKVGSKFTIVLPLRGPRKK